MTKLAVRSPSVLVWEARDYVMSRRSYWHSGMSKYQARYSTTSNLHHNDCHEKRASLWQKPKHFSARKDIHVTPKEATLHPDSAARCTFEKWPTVLKVKADYTTGTVVCSGKSDQDYSNTDSNSSNSVFVQANCVPVDSVSVKHAVKVSADVHSVPRDSLGPTPMCASLVAQLHSMAEHKPADDPHCTDRVH